MRARLCAALGAHAIRTDVALPAQTVRIILAESTHRSERKQGVGVGGAQVQLHILKTLLCWG